MLLLPFGPRYIGDLIGITIVLLIHVLCACMLWRWIEPPAWLRRHAWFERAWPRRIVPWVIGCSAAVVVFGFLLRSARIARHLPPWFGSWGRGIAVTWAFLSVLIAIALMVSRVLLRARAHHSPERRKFLAAAQGAFFGVPLVVTGYGVFIERFQISLREAKIEIPGLPPDLDGLRLVQVTDIHLSPFLSEKQLAYAVDLANEARGHLMLVTGDLITSGADPLDVCLKQLSRLRAEAGVFGCNGNHETYAKVEEYVESAAARFGMRVLRSSSQSVRFGAAKVNLAGVDYQPKKKAYLRGMQNHVEPGAFNILLSHNPDVFPVAAQKGYQLTLAGHTHGGQVRVEILHQDLNIARFFTPYVDGKYRLSRRPDGSWSAPEAGVVAASSAPAEARMDASSSIFVSRGIGTIALPARIGAPPEVALLRLCRI